MPFASFDDFLLCTLATIRTVSPRKKTNHIDQEVNAVVVSAADVAEYQQGHGRDVWKVLQDVAQVDAAGQEGEAGEEENTQVALEKVVPGETKKEFAAVVGNNSLLMMEVKDRKVGREKTLVA
jgi:hypothetical protein